VPEVAQVREHHRHAALVGCLDDVGGADAAAGLGEARGAGPLAIRSLSGSLNTATFFP